MTTSLSIPETSVPVPARYWWLKRLSLLGLAVLLGMTVAWFAWARHAERQLAATFAEMRARGEPVEPADFAAQPIPDAENAAFLLQKAAAALSRDAESPSSSRASFPDVPPYPAEWWAMARAAFDANGEALQRARLARSKPRSAFPRPTSSPLLNWPTAWLNQQRQLANLLADAAMYRHLSGDDREAVRLVLDLLRAADAQSEEPLLIPHLVGIGIHALGARAALRIAPGLSMSDAERGLDTPRIPADPDDLRQLIDALLDDTRHAAAVRRAFGSERVFIMDTVRWGTRGSRLLRPAFDLGIVNTREPWAGLLRAGDANRFREARRSVRPKGNPGWLRLGEAMVGTLIPSLDRVLESGFRNRADQRMAAVSLAANLFRRDTGRWPARLEELVPRYLPAVPIDPMANEEVPLRYVLAEGGRRPMVYSAGADGAFEDFADDRLPAGPRYGWMEYKRNDPRLDDQYRDLSRFDPPPTTQPDDAAP